MKGRHPRVGTAPRKMIIECGDFKCRITARSINDAVIGAFSKDVPKNPSLLLRVWDGVWHYIDFIAALRIAGYTVNKTKTGWKVG